ncbi:MAG: hypothetical protein HZA17_04030 [Nitrospirae bacterium]|nr:hypothetical protein [Nitrospirota bacterium]
MAKTASIFVIIFLLCGAAYASWLDKVGEKISNIKERIAPSKATETTPSEETPDYEETAITEKNGNGESIDDLLADKPKPKDKPTKSGTSKGNFLHAIADNDPALIDKITDSHNEREIAEMVLNIMEQDGVEVPTINKVYTIRRCRVYLDMSLGPTIIALAKYKLDTDKSNTETHKKYFSEKLSSIEKACVNQMGRPLPFSVALKGFLNEYLEALNILSSKLDDERIKAERERLAAETRRLDDERKQKAVKAQKLAEMDKERNELEAKKQEENKKQMALEERKRIADEEARRKALLEYKAALKSGKKPVESCGDAAILYDAVDGVSVVLQPPVSPTGKYYKLNCLIDHIEEGGLLSGGTYVCKFGDNYFAVKTTGKTKFKDKNAISINTNIYMVGKHIARRNYQTVIGALKVMSVFEAAFIE